MDKELKDKWVAALRSGEYKQGRSYLKRGDLYCCLGVLCEVAQLPSWDTHADMAYLDGNQAMIPLRILKQLELDYVFAKELAYRNDGVSGLGQVFEHHTFTEIADIIEERA